MIALNLLLQSSKAELWIFFPALLSWFAQSTIKIEFLVEIPIRITNAICEKIFILELKSKIKIIPPNTLNGTVNIITTGWIKLLKFAAITKKAVNNASANIINRSLLVSFNSSDFPFHSILASGVFLLTVFSRNSKASESV